MRMIEMYERNKLQEKQLFTLLLQSEPVFVDRITVFIDFHHCIQTNEFKLPQHIVPTVQQKSMYMSHTEYKEKERNNAADVIACLQHNLPKQFCNMLILTHFVFSKDDLVNTDHLNPKILDYYAKHFDYTPPSQYHGKQISDMQTNVHLLSELLKFIIENGKEYAQSICIHDQTLLYCYTPECGEYTVTPSINEYVMPSFEMARQVIAYYNNKRVPVHLYGVSDITIGLLGIKLNMTHLANIHYKNSPLMSEMATKRISDLLTHKLQQFHSRQSLFTVDLFFKSLCILSVISCIGYESGNEYLRVPSFDKLFLSYMTHESLFEPMILYKTSINGRKNVSVNHKCLVGVIEKSILGENCNLNFDDFFKEIKQRNEKTSSDIKVYKNQEKFQHITNTITFTESNIVEDAVFSFADLLINFI